MRPIKAIMALLAAILILPACNEEEWENLTYEQKYIETLLYQQKPKNDIGYELVDSMRYVILKTGIQLSPEEAKKGLNWQPDRHGFLMVTGADYFAEYHYGCLFEYSTDTIGIVRSVSILRQELKLSDENILTYKGFEVVGIEDVTVEKGPIIHSLELDVYSEKDVPKVVEYINSIGCRVACIRPDGYFDDVYINIALPLDKKAIPIRDKILSSNLKLKAVYVTPYLSQFHQW